MILKKIKINKHVRWQTMINDHPIIEDRVESIEQVNNYLENEHCELKEQFQTHSM